LKKLFFVLIILCLLIPFYSCQQEIKLSLSVYYNVTDFQITNTGNEDYTNLKIVINDKYEYRLFSLKAGEKVIIDSIKFTDKDGNMFKPLDQLPKKVFISADTPKGKGYYYGEWKY